MSCSPLVRLTMALALFGLAAATQPARGAPADELRKAAAAGDAAAVRRLLASGAPVDGRDPSGRTALLLAVEHDHLEAATLLMDAGASINAQAQNLDSPWLLAGARGRTAMLRQMIAKGPDLSLRNRFGGNALIPACHYGHVETARLLLTTAIDVNHVNNLGWTCLLELVILGDGSPAYVVIARMVLAAGGNPNIVDRDGVSPLAHARRRGQAAVAREIEAAGGR